MDWGRDKPFAMKMSCSSQTCNCTAGISDIYQGQILQQKGRQPVTCSLVGSRASPCSRDTISAFGTLLSEDNSLT